MAARIVVQICCPTVTQQFSNAICNAVLTVFPSSSARLFSVATRPKGMAKDPVSGITESVMHAWSWVRAGAQLYARLRKYFEFSALQAHGRAAGRVRAVAARGACKQLPQWL